MHKNGLRERIVPGSVFFLHKGFARLRPRKAKIQLMSAVRNAKPALLVQSHRQHHAEAVLPVVIQQLSRIPKRLLLFVRGESRLLRKELFRLHRLQPVVDLGPAPVLLEVNRVGVGRGQHTAVRHTELFDVCFSFAVVFSHRNGVCRLLHFLFPRRCVVGPGAHSLRRHQLQQHDQNQQQRKQGFSNFSHVCLLSMSVFSSRMSEMIFFGKYAYVVVLKRHIQRKEKEEHFSPQPVFIRQTQYNTAKLSCQDTSLRLFSSSYVPLFFSCSSCCFIALCSTKRKSASE